MNWTKGLKNKVGCETCNKYIEKILYENLIGIRFHINNLYERTIQKKCVRLLILTSDGNYLNGIKE